MAPMISAFARRLLRAPRTTAGLVAWRLRHDPSWVLLKLAGAALMFVCIGIVLYLWFRFEWKFGVAAIVANLHDVVIILGCFALFQWEFSLPVLAAVLAILGYSVN